MSGTPPVRSSRRPRISRRRNCHGPGTLRRRRSRGILPERLTAAGLVEEAAEPCMAVDLRSLPKTWEAAEGLSIEKVSPGGLGGEYAEVLSAGFGLPEEISRDFAEIINGAVPDEEVTIAGYLGRLDGRAVSTSMLVAAGGVAGIYNVATLADFRGRGIGAALTIAPLLEVSKSGYRIGALQSSEMGYGVYQRLGFREYCRLRQLSGRVRSSRILARRRLESARLSAAFGASATSAASLPFGFPRSPRNRGARRAGGFSGWWLQDTPAICPGRLFPVRV